MRQCGMDALQLLGLLDGRGEMTVARSLAGTDDRSLNRDPAGNVVVGRMVVALAIGVYAAPNLATPLTQIPPAAKSPTTAPATQGDEQFDLLELYVASALSTEFGPGGQPPRSP